MNQCVVSMLSEVERYLWIHASDPIHAPGFELVILKKKKLVNRSTNELTQEIGERVQR